MKEKERGCKMGKESEDKAERVLSIYTRLKNGKVIHKERESREYGVSSRTIQRDLADIQCFLQNQCDDTGEEQEIVFHKEIGGYVLQRKASNQLESKEVLAVAKILLDSRSLMKNEMFPIIKKLISMCSDETEIRQVEDMIRNEMYHYVELQHGQQLLDRVWVLEKAVKNQQFLEIKYKRLKNQEIVTRKIKPVGIIFSGFYFYLTAFIEDIDKQGCFQNPNDISPTIYRIDRMQEFKVLDEHFAVPYTERFEEGEFRKRVQFMYGGKLRKIRLQCTEECLEALLDRLPTAEVVEKKKDGYVVKAEVFGDGIDMWLKGQGEKIVLY